MLGLGGGKVKRGALKPSEVPFPGEVPGKEPEQIWCSSSSVVREQRLAGRVAVRALSEQGLMLFCFCFLDPAPASSTQELICNRTWELKENSESKEGLVAAGTVLGVGERYGGGVPRRSGELDLDPL